MNTNTTPSATRTRDGALTHILGLAHVASARTTLAAMSAYLANDSAFDDIPAVEATLRDRSPFVRQAVPWSNPPEETSNCRGHEHYRYRYRSCGDVLRPSIPNSFR